MSDSAALRGPIYLSILAGFLTLGLKLTGYFITGSIGLLSDALESLVHPLASFTALFALWYASRPVDASHPYGHEKIVYFASGLEGLLIFGAGIGMAVYGVMRLIWPVPLTQIGVGALLAVAASLINLTVGLILVRVGRARESIVLEADGLHLLTDVWTSVAVISALVLVMWTGWQAFDPLIALLMAGNIGWMGVKLILRSFNGLMDRALPAEDLARLREVIEGQLPPGATYHALRSRRAGSYRMADFHLLVPGQTSVTEAHALAERIERAVEEVFPRIELVIHIEPSDEPRSWEDNILAGLEPTFRSEEEMGERKD